MNDRLAHAVIRVLGHCLVTFVLCLFIGAAAAAEFVELVVPTTDDLRYSRRQLCEQLNRKFGTRFPVDVFPDGNVQLLPVEQAALLAADAAGIIKVRFETNQIVLRIENPEDDLTRRRNRRRLGRFLGIPLDEWPPGMGLKLPAAFDASARTIVLVHGLESDEAELKPFSLACEHWGVQPLLFNYPNDGPPAWSGEHLSLELKALAGKHPQLRVVLVGHSMGGLVSRYCLETPDKNPGCVTDLFTLGTPHLGSDLAGMQPLVEMAAESWAKGHDLWQMLEDGLGEAGRDLMPKSEFLLALNSRSRPDAVLYHAAAGRKSLLRPWIRWPAQMLVDEAAARNRVPKSVSDALTVFLQAEEFQDGRGDGAVTIRSALLSDIKDQAVFDLNHGELLSLSDDRPEDHEVFRWIMGRLGWPSRKHLDD